ncbi:5280_t:CDS:2, partial [Funneliformis geosporum]
MSLFSNSNIISEILSKNNSDKPIGIQHTVLVGIIACHISDTGEYDMTCISRGKLSKLGELVQDSHAE